MKEMESRWAVRVGARLREMLRCGGYGSRRSEWMKEGVTEAPRKEGTRGKETMTEALKNR